MASGAGLNRVGGAGGVVLLTLTPTATAVTLPAYGNLGNDSWGTLSGAGSSASNAMAEAQGFTKWQFALVPAPGQTTFSGYSVTLLGTVDSRAYGQWEASINPYKYYNTTAPTLPAGSWFLLPAPSDQSGTGSDANPLTSTNPLLNVSRPLVAVRAVLTGVTAPAGSCQVIGFAVP